MQILVFWVLRETSVGMFIIRTFVFKIMIAFIANAGFGHLLGTK